jgi:hypothetical protein
LAQTAEKVQLPVMPWQSWDYIGLAPISCATALSKLNSPSNFAPAA